jgi:hypothetical protein
MILRGEFPVAGFLAAMCFIVAATGCARSDGHSGKGVEPPPSKSAKKAASELAAKKKEIYWSNRRWDFADIFELGGSFSGMGLHAEVHCTQYARLGAGWQAHLMALLNPEGVLGGYILLREIRELSIGPYWKSIYYQGLMVEPHEFIPEERRSVWSIGASASVLFLSVAIAIHPPEIIDFLYGWFGFDIFADDSPLPGENEPAG